MRTWPRAALDRYLRIDEPYDCAGAAKIESLGIALVDRVQSDDPTALIGLPLIRLTAMLAAAGAPVPADDLNGGRHPLSAAVSHCRGH